MNAARALSIWTAALAAAALAGAACHQDSPSACFESGGLPYRFSLPTDSTEVFHWPTSRRLKVYAEPVGNLSANTDRGLALWTAAPRCGGVSFTRTDDSTQADIIVRNPHTIPLSGAPGAQLRMGSDSVGACVGVTFADIDTTTHPWTLHPPMRSYVSHQGSDSAATEACYHFTVVHELGHAIGLLSHSHDTNDIMFMIPRRPVLSVNDRVTLEVLLSTSPTIVLAH